MKKNAIEITFKYKPGPFGEPGRVCGVIYVVIDGEQFRNGFLPARPMDWNDPELPRFVSMAATALLVWADDISKNPSRRAEILKRAAEANAGDNTKP